MMKVSNAFGRLHTKIQYLEELFLKTQMKCLMFAVAARKNEETSICIDD